MRELLSHEAELYGATNRTLIAQSDWQARLWIADIIARLYDPNTTVLASVQKSSLTMAVPVSPARFNSSEDPVSRIYEDFEYCESNIIIFFAAKTKAADRELELEE